MSACMDQIMQIGWRKKEWLAFWPWTCTCMYVGVWLRRKVTERDQNSETRLHTSASHCSVHKGAKNDGDWQHTRTETHTEWEHTCIEAAVKWSMMFQAHLSAHTQIPVTPDTEPLKSSNSPGQPRHMWKTSEWMDTHTFWWDDVGRHRLYSEQRNEMRIEMSGCNTIK